MTRALMIVASLFTLARCKSELKQEVPPPPAPAAVDQAPPGLPAGHPPLTVQSATPAVPGGEIEGRLEVAPAFAKQVKAGDTIFLIARSASSNAMVAVAKLAAPASFPLPFKLGAGNAMLPGGGGLVGPVKLSARVDKDGDPMSKNPGDVVGEVAQPVPVPAHDIVLTLDRGL